MSFRNQFAEGFQNSYTDNGSSGSGTAPTGAEASAFGATPQTNPGGVSPPPTPVAPPGFDVVDGVASVIFAPGRAIVQTIRPVTMSDLPLVIGLSAVTWYAAYRWAWPWIKTNVFDGFASTSEPVKRKKYKTVKVDADSGEEVEDED